MKQLIVKGILPAILFLGLAQMSQAQHIYVKVQPQERVVARSVAPRSNYVWINGEYMIRGARYVYRPGYWARPHAGFVWIPGHWMQTHRGWYWAPGYWARRR